MKAFTKYLTMQVPARMMFVNITPEVDMALVESGVREGLCLVNAMHITASVFINDDESGLHRDYEVWLEELAPFDPSPERYHHNRTGEDNADAHHKRQIIRWPATEADSDQDHRRVIPDWRFASQPPHLGRRVRAAIERSGTKFRYIGG